MLVYRTIRSVLAAAMNVFFQEIRLVGTEHVAEEGARPILFAGNHPNSLIDPVLLCTTSGRVVHFAAKDKLFRFPMSAILRALGAVPIARRMDYADGGSRQSNEGALDRLHGVLAQGRAVGIFPEGLSHNAAHLQRLRTGAARIALQTASQEPEAGVQIVCCGLCYVRRRQFRSRVLVQYGEPIVIDDAWIRRFEQDPRAAAVALTERIDMGLRALTVNAPDWDTLRVLDGVRRLYQPRHISLEQRVELSRRFSLVYERVRDNPMVKALYDDVEAYLDHLDRVGLSDRDLVRGLDRWQLLGRLLRNLATLVVWLPLALPGAPVHLPLLLAVGWMGRHFAPRKDVIGTSRLVLGVGTVLAAYIALPLAVGLWWGVPWALATSLALPVSGFATLRVLERGVSLRRLWRSFRGWVRLGYELKTLRVWRTELEGKVVRAVQQLIPDDMVPLFPERAGQPRVD